MVLVPQLDALRAENRRLRREAGDREALSRIRSDTGGKNSKACLSHFAAPPTRRSPSARRTGPVLADPFPEADSLPGAYRLHLPTDGLTIWYTVTETSDGQTVIVRSTSRPTHAQEPLT